MDQSYAAAFQTPEPQSNMGSYGDAFTQVLGTMPARSYADAFGQPEISDNTSIQTPSMDPWENFKQEASNVVNLNKLPKAVLPVMLGQAALESARGSAAPGNNYFGIKGSGNAGSNNLSTQEYGNGGYYGENSDFAGYKSPTDSINAYLKLILSYPGVSAAIQQNDPVAILKAIEANGYATSPTYVENVMNTPEFRQYANMEGGQ